MRPTAHTVYTLRATGARSPTGLRHALAYAWFLEDAARVDLAVRAAGGPVRVYSQGEAADRDLASGGLFSRMWAWLTDGDPEG